MKKISKKDSERIYNYILKARKIIDSAEDLSEDNEACLHDSEVAYDCISSISGIMVALNNTVM